MEPHNEEMSRSAHAPQNQKKPKKKKGKIFLGIFLTLLFLFCLAVLSGIGVFWYYAKDAPALDDQKLQDSQSAKFFDASGNLIQELGEKKRETIEANQIPTQLKNAITSIEDKRFYKHIGIDPIRIAGSAISNLRGNSLQGGSTLTQQLIKLSYYSTKEEDQTLRRKAQEAWLSLKLEREKSKDEILMYYINKVYMANGLYGMETAAESYFGKTLSDISLAQTALLAGMPQAPNDYDPYTHPEAAKERRDMVLKEMYKDKKISEKQYQEAVNTPINEGLLPLTRNSDNIRIIDNYLKEVIAEVEKKTGKDVYKDGMDIYTNLDFNAQKYLYDLVNTDDYIQFPSDEFQTAVTVIDVNTGQVKAQIGGRKIAEDVMFGENLAVSAKRDVGSTVKPITDYAPAIENLDLSTAQRVLDEPYSYPDAKDKQVRNYDYNYRGVITMRQALTDSRNVPAVKMLDEVGLDKSAEFLKKIGIEYNHPLNYANAISGEISSLQLAAAYASFANGGTYYKPYYVNRVVMPDGEEIKWKPEGAEAMKDSTAFMITDMLKDVINYGTGTTAQIEGLPQAGKTGTSNYPDGFEFIGDYGGVPDITFVGYTRNFSVSVWTGNKEYKQAIGPNETDIAAKIYRFLMEYISRGIDTPDWQKPDDVTQQGNEYFVNGNYNTWSLLSKNNKYNSYSNSSSSYQKQSSYEETPSSSSSSSSSAAPVETVPSSEVTPPPASSSQEPPTSSDSTPPPESSAPPEPNGGNGD